MHTRLYMPARTQACTPLPGPRPLHKPQSAPYHTHTYTYTRTCRTGTCFGGTLGDSPLTNRITKGCARAVCITTPYHQRLDDCSSKFLTIAQLVQAHPLVRMQRAPEFSTPAILGLRWKALGELVAPGARGRREDLRGCHGP